MTSLNTAVASTPMTVEEFLVACRGRKQAELVRGYVVDCGPPGLFQGVIAAAVGSRLWSWSREREGGFVGISSGFVLERDPDTVRGPDVYYVRPERAAELAKVRSFAEFPPDLAVEVISPGDSGEQIVDKVDQYLAAGTAQVWVISPEHRGVHVHLPEGTTRRLASSDTLTGGDLLPGFSVPVSDLFAGL